MSVADSTFLIVTDLAAGAGVPSQDDPKAWQEAVMRHVNDRMADTWADRTVMRIGKTVAVP